MSRLVIIGGRDAGSSAALRARELDSDSDVTMVVADAYPNFSICGIPVSRVAWFEEGSTDVLASAGTRS